MMMPRGGRGDGWLVGNDFDGMQALAMGYADLNQMSKSRNFLKYIGKMEWKHQFADDFESAWLTMADLAIQVGTRAGRGLARGEAGDHPFIHPHPGRATASTMPRST